MDEKDNQQLTYLINIGQANYYQMHSQLLKEICPSGNFSSAEWNEASVEAIIAAVARMIQENNALLLTKTGQNKGTL